MTSPHTWAGGSKDKANAAEFTAPKLPAPSQKVQLREGGGRMDLQSCCSVSKAMRHDGCSSQRGHRSAMQSRSWGNAHHQPSPTASVPRCCQDLGVMGVLGLQCSQCRSGAISVHSPCGDTQAAPCHLPSVPGMERVCLIHLHSCCRVLQPPVDARPGVLSLVQEKHEHSAKVVCPSTGAPGTILAAASPPPLPPHMPGVFSKLIEFREISSWQ